MKLLLSELELKCNTELHLDPFLTPFNTSIKTIPQVISENLRARNNVCKDLTFSGDYAICMNITFALF